MMPLIFDAVTMATGSSSFNAFIKWMIEQQVARYILPFLLVFALIYAILRETKIISKKNSINTILALALALLFVWYGDSVTIGNSTLLQIVNSSILEITIILLAVLMLMILFGSLGSTNPNFKKHPWIRVGVVFFSVAVLIVVFLWSAGLLNSSPGVSNWFENHKEMWNILVPLLVFGIIVWFVTSEEQPGKGKKALKKAGKAVKKGINDMGDAVFGEE